MTLVKEVSYLVGIPINYYAVMDLDGFVKMIDRVGGIDVDNPSAINDPSYDWPTADVRLLPGSRAAAPRRKHALAYVRPVTVPTTATGRGLAPAAGDGRAVAQDGGSRARYWLFQA